MSEQDNLQLIKQMYAAFGDQGDTAGGTPTTLDLMAGDGEWEFSGPAELLPWAGLRRGREETAQALATLDELVEFEQFTPCDFLAQGNKVVVLGDERGRVRATGRTFDNTWVHVITMQNSKIMHFRTYDDTAAVVAAVLEK